MGKWIRLLRRFRQQTPERQLLLVDGLIALVCARLALQLFSFKKLTARLRRAKESIGGRSRGETERICRDVGWAVERIGDMLPGMTCFPRGLAAQWMCRSRGVDAVLYYGVAVFPEKGLAAHVWVQSGDRGVVGHTISSDYRVMSRFPQ